jgi:D-psicose/D-tagatose/L-ribulose 3-epimerase
LTKAGLWGILCEIFCEAEIVDVDWVKLGVCAPLEHILLAERAGFEYIEGNLSEAALMPERSFRTLCALVHEAGIRCEVMGYMLPRELSVIGRGVNAAQLHAYLDLAFDRARRLGAELVVFASAAARQVPIGWPTDVAWRQLANFLRIVERHATDHQLTVAIEPLSRMECNLLSTVAEATLLCSILQLKHIRVMADTYHMAMEHELSESITMAGPMLAHVHTANALGRSFPKPGDGEDYGKLFRTLKEIDYRGRVSVEARYDNFEEEAHTAFTVLDQARSGV